MHRSRLKRLVAARRYFPLSRLGIAMVALAWWSYSSLSRNAADLVLGTVALGALGLVVISLIVSGVTTLWLRRHLRSNQRTLDLKLESGTSTVTGFAYADLSRWPLMQVRMEWIRPPSVEVETQIDQGWQQEIILPRLRGRFTEITRRFWVSDIFGFTRFTFDTTRAQRGLILPHRTSLTRQGLQHMSGGDAVSHPGNPPEGELLEMRRYAHGDPLRLVLWKVYGRTRQLLVRAPEQAITPNPNATAYFVAGNDDEATASIARLYLEEGLLGKNFLFLADGANKPANNLNDAMEQLVSSAEHRHRGGAGADLFMDRLSQEQSRALILFLPAAPGPWITSLRKMAQRLPRAQVIIGYDIEDIGAKRHWLSRFLFADALKKDRSDHQVSHVVRAIAPLGWTIEIIHRPSGHVFTAAQVLNWAA